MSGENNHAEFSELQRSLSGWQTLLQEDPMELQKVAELWKEICEQILDCDDAFRTKSDGELKASTGYFGPLSNIDYRGYRALTFTLAWWCDTSTRSIDPTPFTETLRHAEYIFGAFALRGRTTIETPVECRKSFCQSKMTLERMVNVAFYDIGKSPPDPEFKKHKPTPATLRVIELLREGLDNNAIVLKTNKSIAAVRKISSRLAHGEYDLDS